VHQSPPTRRRAWPAQALCCTLADREPAGAKTQPITAASQQMLAGHATDGVCAHAHATLEVLGSCWELNRGYSARIHAAASATIFDMQF